MLRCELNLFFDDEHLSMPYLSKHSDDVVESLVNDLLITLEKHKATTDLSLMALGNTLTHLFNQNVTQNQRSLLVKKFNEILVQSTT